LVQKSVLAKLASDLDREAIARSSGALDIEAAQASLNAQRFDRLPQLRPTASAPLTGSGQPSFGVNVEQLIWDGGRILARRSEAELIVAEASLTAWSERNEIVL
jgi:outer membrane protein TolC